MDFSFSAMGKKISIFSSWWHGCIYLVKVSLWLAGENVLWEGKNEDRKTSCPAVSCSAEKSENFCYDSSCGDREKQVLGYVSVAKFTGLADRLDWGFEWKRRFQNDY